MLFVGHGTGFIMTQIRPDSVILTSLIEAYQNFETLTSTMSISGTIANGGGDNFIVVLSATRSNVIGDIYATNQNTGKKMLLNAGNIHHPYQAISTETDAHSISLNDSVITITLSIDNFTGGDITLVDQVWDITAVLYEVPY